MATGILILLTVVLVAAACYVGLLLLRRSRPVTQGQLPRTVGELVRRRSTPIEQDLSGTDLFTPKGPQPADVVPPPADAPVPTGTAAGSTAVPPPPSAPATTPPGGVEVGDAPWRRAARLLGSEPGAAWETAPLPVVPVVPVVPVAQPGPRIAPAAPEAVRTAVVAVPEPEPEPAAAPVGAPTATPTGPVPVVADGSSAVPRTPAPSVTDDGPPPVADAPSRPLSDPDLTPLMGIPVVRPLVESPAPPPAAAAEVDPEPRSGPETRPEPDTRPVAPRPVTPRLTRPSAIDDDVVSLLPSTLAPRPPRATAGGSPQPVWFRVVRRDAEPVAGVVVTLLDDHGQEADATKTATDGGGELHAPHGGWFLMVASADGFQPRAVTLAVDDKPVEIALLLPRSATVAGAVRDADGPVAGTRVVAFQEGEVVDEIMTDTGGGFRFGDLAEGVYALSASGARGGAVGRVTLSEGAEVQLDLDLVR